MFYGISPRLAVMLFVFLVGVIYLILKTFPSLKATERKDLKLALTYGGISTLVALAIVAAFSAVG